MMYHEITKVKEAIKKEHPDKQEELQDEFTRYVGTNDAKNANRMTWVSLTPELRKIIATVKGKITGTKLYK